VAIPSLSHPPFLTIALRRGKKKRAEKKRGGGLYVLSFFQPIEKRGRGLQQTRGGRALQKGRGGTEFPHLCARRNSFRGRKERGDDNLLHPASCQVNRNKRERKKEKKSMYRPQFSNINLLNRTERKGGGPKGSIVKRRGGGGGKQRFSPPQLTGKRKKNEWEEVIKVNPGKRGKKRRKRGEERKRECLWLGGGGERKGKERKRYKTL